MSPQELERLRKIAAQAGAQYGQGNATPSGPPKKDFWTDQISTATGTVGGLLGGVLGTVAGPVGTVGGAAAGASLGSGAGEWLENKLMGEEDQFKNVGQEALLGGVFGAGPIRAANIAYQGGKAALRGGAVKEALEKGATATPIRNAIGRGGRSATKAGDRLMASQSGMTASQARTKNIQPVKTFGSINARTGLNNLDDMAEFGRRVTGAGDESLLDTVTRAAVSDARGVDLADIRTVATKLLDDTGAGINSSKRKEILEHVRNAGTQMYGGSKGSISASADPQAALDIANTFRDIARNSKSGFNPSTQEKMMGKVYDGLAKHIEDTIYKAPGVDQSIKGLTKAAADDFLFMADDLAQAGKNAQAEAARRLAKEVRGAKSLKDIRSLKRDFVEVANIDKATGQAQGTRVLTGENTIQNALNPFRAVGVAADAAAPRAGGALSGVGRRFDRGPGDVPLTPARSAGNIAAGGSLMNALGAAPDVTQEDAALAATDPALDPTLMDAGLEQPQADNPFGVTPDQIQQAMMMALMDGDTDAYSQLEKMYELVQPAEADLSAAERAAQAKSQNALNTVNTLEGALESAGGGRGRIGGTIANALGSVGLNDEVSAYNDVSRGSMAQIIRGLGESGALSDGDVQRGLSMLPRVTDNPREVEAKMSILRTMIEASIANPAGGGVAQPAPQQAF